jgi:hypothetical protein
VKKGGAAPLSLGNTRGGSHVPVKRVRAVSGNKKKKEKQKDHKQETSERGGAPQNQAERRVHPKER